MAETKSRIEREVLDELLRGVGDEYDLTGVLRQHLPQICLVYINTLMMQQVLAEPEWQGRLTTTDLRALTPLKWQHINPYGTFTLNMNERLPLAQAA